MAIKQLSNPAGLNGLTADPEYQIIIPLLNNSGGSVLPGDVGVVDVTGCKFATTTTASDGAVIGVVTTREGDTMRVALASDAVADQAVCYVLVQGVGRISIAANTVAAKGVLATSTAAKVAATPGAPADATALQALLGSFIGKALEANGAKDANSCIRAIIGKF